MFFSCSVVLSTWDLDGGRSGRGCGATMLIVVHLDRTLEYWFWTVWHDFTTSCVPVLPTRNLVNRIRGRVNHILPQFGSTRKVHALASADLHTLGLVTTDCAVCASHSVDLPYSCQSVPVTEIHLLLSTNRTATVAYSSPKLTGGAALARQWNPAPPVQY